jgi:hypothetical protein
MHGMSTRQSRIQTKYVNIGIIQKYSPTAGVSVFIFVIYVRVVKYTLYDIVSIRRFGALAHTLSPKKFPAHNNFY